MDNNTQGVPAAASADPAGQGATAAASAGVVDPALQGLMSSPSADPSAAPDPAQGGAQGGAQGQPEDLIGKRIQSEVDKVQARFLSEKYQLEQRLAQAEQRLMQPQTQQQGNPYDYNTQFPDWFRYEQQAGIKAATEAAQKTSMETLQNMMAQAGEMQWIQQHPGVDVTAIKQFNRQNGIAEWNLDAGYKLLNFPNQIASAAQQASQQTLNQFRQPTNGSFAQPVRGNNGGMQAPSFDFKKLVEAAAKNPAIIDALPEADQKEFWAVMQRIREG